jgi:hypothetical protein
MPAYNVVCTLPNASNSINGIKFVPHETIPNAVRSAEPVPEQHAEVFKGIKGYTVQEAKTKSAAATQQVKPIAQTPAQTKPTAPAAPVAPATLADATKAAEPETQPEPGKLV